MGGLLFSFTQNFGQSVNYATEYLDRNTTQQTRLDSQSEVKTQFDKAAVTRDIIPPGSPVRIQDSKTKRWSGTGIVESMRNNVRSYTIVCSDSMVILRNRRFIKLRTA